MNQKLEEHKQSSLDKQKKGEGHWHEELASDAEAFVSRQSGPYRGCLGTWNFDRGPVWFCLWYQQVKAERSEIKATGAEIDKLQKETNELLKKKGL